MSINIGLSDDIYFRVYPPSNALLSISKRKMMPRAKKETRSCWWRDMVYSGVW
jgi:hypothetical protein